MDCRSVKSRLSEFADGMLAPADMSAVNHHIQGCQNCRRELHELEQTIALLHSLSEIKPPDDLVRMVRARIASSQTRSTGRRLWFFLSSTQFKAAAAACLVLGICTYGLLRVLPESPQVDSARVSDASRTRDNAAKAKSKTAARDVTADGAPVVAAETPQASEPLLSKRQSSTGKLESCKDDKKSDRSSIGTDEAATSLAYGGVGDTTFRGADGAAASVDRVQQKEQTLLRIESEEEPRSVAEASVSSEKTGDRFARKVASPARPAKRPPMGPAAGVRSGDKAEGASDMQRSNGERPLPRTGLYEGDAYRSLGNDDSESDSLTLGASNTRVDRNEDRLPGDGVRLIRLVFVATNRSALGQVQLDGVSEGRGDAGRDVAASGSVLSGATNYVRIPSTRYAAFIADLKRYGSVTEQADVTSRRSAEGLTAGGEPKAAMGGSVRITVEIVP